jgi:hypothetical protein
MTSSGISPEREQYNRPGYLHPVVLAPTRTDNVPFRWSQYALSLDVNELFGVVCAILCGKKSRLML